MNVNSVVINSASDSDSVSIRDLNFMIKKNHLRIAYRHENHKKDHKPYQ